MPTSFLCALHLRPPLDTDAAALRLAASLGVFRGHGLQPFAFSEPAWREGTPLVFGATTLAHPAFAERTGDPIWGAGFMVVPAPHAQASVVTMTTPAEPLGTPDDAWHWLTALAEALCDATAADVGMINGFSVRGGRAVGSTPAGPELAPGAAPRLLLPWMYWGPERLAEPGMRAGLETLAAAAYRGGPTPGGGWVVQATEAYSAAPPEALMAACREAFGTEPIWLGVR